MIGIDAAAIVFAIIVVIGFYVSKTAKDVVKTTHKPNGELAKAMRLLDKIVAYDDAVSVLSQDLRNEAKKMTEAYFKETINEK